MSDTAIIPAPPAPKPSWMARFVEAARGTVTSAPAGSTGSYITKTISVAGNYGQAGAIGLLLGAARAKWPNSKAEGILTGIGMFGSIALSQASPWWADRLERMGEVSFGIMMAGKGYSFVGGAPSSPSGTPGVTPPSGIAAKISGEDPIVAASKEF